MSYLLRHNPENLEMDDEGFVKLDLFLQKLKEKYNVTDNLIHAIVNDPSGKKRFEIINNKIRATYGHTISVKINYPEDKTTPFFYHGTTPNAAQKILKEGLKPMKRQWIHLSPTIETAKETAKRKTATPIILEINAEKSRKNGIKFYKANKKIYLSKYIPPNHIKILHAKHKKGP
jgi:putative RNA 2'-phosphotransferase